MKRYCLIAGFLFLVQILLSGACGRDESNSPEVVDTLEIDLYADKDVYVNLSVPVMYNDSILQSNGRISSVLLERESGEVIVLRALVIPGCGSSASDMCDYLLQRDISARVDSGTTRPFTAITYLSRDSSVVERIWQRGSRELIVLQAKRHSNSPTILLDDVRSMFDSASPLFKPEYANQTELMTPRNVYPADRLYDRISTDIQQSCTTAAPSIRHSMVINVHPEEQTVTVIDTLTVDFSSTRSNFKLSFYLSENCIGAEISDICGSSEIEDDSLVCISDSTRLFMGIFKRDYEGTKFYSDENYALRGYQIRAPSSFQCGEWFYPECEYPADYTIEITVPDTTYSVYVPLNEISSAGSMNSDVTFTYTSDAGGIKGPIAWAVSNFEQIGISYGRSKLYLGSTLDSRDELKSVAEGMADNLWESLNYTGAKLDFVVVESLDTSIFMAGPGCVFASEDVLLSVSDCSWWDDSLSSGSAVRETMIPAGAAMAFLSRSTYLDNTIREMLIGWTVYKYASNRHSENSSTMLEAFLKYYLYETELEGGVEYALADPLLSSSGIAAPIIMGKGPLVLEFLSGEIYGFVNTGLRTMLEYQRHTGDSWTRLASALNLSSSSSRRTLFRSWFYQPGIPCIRVTWANPEGSALTLKIEQLQPGHAFPYGSIIDKIEIHTPDGAREVHLRDGSRRNIYIGTVAPGIEVISIDINPDNLLPADIVYRKTLLENI